MREEEVVLDSQQMTALNIYLFNLKNEVQKREMHSLNLKLFYG
jgi:hypothetical protein